MKIITWNCNMAFRKKAEIILTYKPDILIVPECEYPDKLVFKADMPKPTDTFWYGQNQNKGLAVFSFGDFKIKLLDHNPDFKFVLPLNIYNDKTSGQFLLFGHRNQNITTATRNKFGTPYIFTTTY